MSQSEENNVGIDTKDIERVDIGKLREAVLEQIDINGNVKKSAGQQIASLILNTIKPIEGLDVTEFALNQGNWSDDAMYCVTIKYNDDPMKNNVWFFEDEETMGYHATGLASKIVATFTHATITIYEWDLGPNHKATISCNI